MDAEFLRMSSRDSETETETQRGSPPRTRHEAQDSWDSAMAGRRRAARTAAAPATGLHKRRGAAGEARRAGGADRQRGRRGVGVGGRFFGGKFLDCR